MTSLCCSATGASAFAAMRTLRRWLSAVMGSPRRSSAFPPSATTTSMALLSQGGDENRLDGVHAVFRLLECDVVFRLEHLVGDLEAVLQAELVGHLFAHDRLRVVKRRQAVHEFHLRVAAGLHQLLVHLIHQQLIHALLPDLF